MLSRIFNFFDSMLYVLIIPIVALVVVYFVSQKYDTEFRQGLTEYAFEHDHALNVNLVGDYSVICAKNDPLAEELCRPAHELLLFKYGAEAAIVIGVSLFVFLLVSRLISGSNRNRLSVIFPTLTRILLVGLSISILLQGALFVYGAYLAESVFLGAVHLALLGGVGLMTLVGALSLIAVSIRVLKDASQVQPGIQINAQNGRSLIDLVNGVADTVGAPRPDNIVVGLEPSFYVSAAKVALPGASKPLDGTTFYMPIPFLRILSVDELRSVIGHEMGHFKGNDTEYSTKFYPAYSRLNSAIHSLADGEGQRHFIYLPALSFLNLLYNEFAVVERKIGRERELSADAEGAKVSSNKALATALLKFSQYGSLWGYVRKFNISTLNSGRMFDDLGAVYADIAADAHKETNLSFRLTALLASKMAHPNDTHPTLRERLAALGIDPATLTEDDLAPANTPPQELLDNYAEIAKQLSEAEHQLMLRSGYARLPKADASK